MFKLIIFCLNSELFFKELKNEKNLYLSVCFPFLALFLAQCSSKFLPGFKGAGFQYMDGARVY